MFKKREYMKMVVVDACVQFLYIYIYAHLETILFLFSFWKNFFFPMVDCPAFLCKSVPFLSRSLLLALSSLYQYWESIKEFVCFPFVFGLHFFLLFCRSTSYSFDIYICRRQMHTYIQKKRLGVSETNIIEGKRMVLLLLNMILFFFSTFFLTLVAEKKREVELSTDIANKKVRRVLSSLSASFSLSLSLSLSLSSSGTGFFSHSFH